MRIALLGTGAMGTLFGVRLARVAEVWMLGTWAEALEAARTRGLRLSTPPGDETAVLPAVGDPAAAPPCDLALILVKAYQTARAARWARQVLRPGGVALTLQNGLGPLEILQQALGPERVRQGVTTAGATVLGPGHARLGGEGPIWLEAPRGDDGATREIAGLLRAAGFEVVFHPDLRSIVWGKLVANTAINPLTALLDIPNGALLERPAVWRVAEGVACETAAVARAQGISLPFADPVAFVAEVCRQTAANSSSMRQDLQRGRPTEIDALNGAVVRVGRRLNVPTPLNEGLWRQVKAAEQRRLRAASPPTLHPIP
ncbi:MAG: 2-dehydropantoate 2-reductase [Thermoflexus sp.]|uniref:ketopantoate reductase family protein n=1 Tax=Thermoflexus sp. TaxID=1969742 RepID=UPI00331AB22F